MEGTGGGGRGKLGGMGSCEVEGGLCLLFAFSGSLTFLFKLLNVVLKTLLAEDERTTDEEERTNG